MILPVPRFPLTTPPEEWDDLSLLAGIIYLEAEGEPAEGKVGVGWVARNRADRWRKHLRAVLLQPAQFSCLNPEYRARAEARLASAAGEALEQSWRAAAGALWKLLPDPTDGATHYLNVEATKAGRKDGTLPAWAADPADPTRVNAAKVTAVLGRHTFLSG